MNTQKAFNQQLKKNARNGRFSSLNGGPKSIAILGSKENYGFEFGCAAELFISQKQEYGSWYHTEIISPDSVGVELTGLFQFEDKYKILIIPDDHWLNMVNNKLLFTRLRHFHQGGGRIVAFGAGVFILAATGLLDGKPVPGDNLHLARQKLYPLVTFSNHLHFSCDPGLYCAGFGLTTLELGLYLIGKDWGPRYIKAIAQQLRLPPGLVMTILTKLDKHFLHHCSKLKKVMEWVDEHLETIDGIDQLAAQACLSRRSFDRQFRAALGISPKDWLTKKRLERAKEYLTDSELSITEIAVASGFGTSNNLRNNFQKFTGRNPTAYRRKIEL